MPLNICVCGWYLEEYSEFYRNLQTLNKIYPVHIVSHKDSDYLKTLDLPYTVRENTGLEWGAYNHYLMNIWDGQSDVLFCHDDITMNPTAIEGHIYPPEFLISKIAELKVDQAYIFGSRHEEVENYGKHGRMIFMSKEFLTRIKAAGGFWYDTKNQGYTSGEDADLRAAYGCYGYNAGINCFHDQARNVGGDVHRKVYIPAFALAKRGKKGSASLAYGKWTDKVGQIIKKAHRKLQVGCGDNHWNDYINVDMYNNSADIKAPADRLPFEDSSFDLVETHHLIEHLDTEDARKALIEWRRVLSPEGHLFLSCPDIVADFDLLREQQSPELWDKLMDVIYGQPGEGMAHKYGYSRESMTRLLEDAGFEDVEVKTAIGYRPTPSLLAIAKRGSKIVNIAQRRKTEGVTAGFKNDKRTYCQVLRDIYNKVEGNTEITALLEEAYNMGKRMDTKLRQYKGGYDNDWYEATKKSEGNNSLKEVSHGSNIEADGIHGSRQAVSS